MITVKVLDIDAEKERISLGVKQLETDTFTSGLSNIKKGDVVTGTICTVLDKGIEVELEGGLIGIIRKADLSQIAIVNALIALLSERKLTQRFLPLIELLVRSFCPSKLAKLRKKNKSYLNSALLTAAQA